MSTNTTITSRPLGPYMTARSHPAMPDVWAIYARDGSVLGGIEWYARWRQFEFLPQQGAAFSWDCLKALSEFLVELNETKRKGRADQ